MARPAIIRIGSNGEIILKNIDPELTKAIRTLVEGAETKTSPVAMLADSVPVLTQSGVVAVPLTGEHPMTKTAIGVFKDENEVYKFSYVKYNPKSLQAKVEKVVNIGFERAEANEKFKIEAVKTGQVE